MFWQITLCLAILLAITVSEDEPMNMLSLSSNVQSEYQSNTIQKIASILRKYDVDEQTKRLKRVYLSNRSITCNDGSQAGFYLRKSHGSKRWIMYLEGGWYCYDQKSCKARWLEMRNLMTSTQWLETRDVGGILSPNPDENPYFWDANHVYVPYCTSDVWSGSKTVKKPDDTRGFSFMGSEIVVQVVRDLVPLGLENASTFLLVGSSAGGTGVMLNLDRVQNLVNHELGLRHIIVRGVADSGWFLDELPYTTDLESPIDSLLGGIELWQARIPSSCRLRYPNERWKCFIGYRIYPTLSTPLFVFQWTFDEAQLRAYNMAAPVTRQEWDKIHEMGDNLRQTLDNVSAVFAPSCISHSVLTKADWKLIKINDVSFAQILFCWEQMPIQQLLETHRNNNTHSQLNHDEIRKQQCGKPLRHLLRSATRKGRNDTMMEEAKNQTESFTEMQEAQSSVTGKMYESKAMPSSSRERKNKRKRKRKHRGRKRERKNKERNKEEKTKKEKHKRRKGGGRKGGRKQVDKQDNNSAMFNGTRPQRSLSSNNRRRCTHDCHFRIIERCTWPQCNHSCPKLHNPFTGEEIDFIKLLKSFGSNTTLQTNTMFIPPANVIRINAYLNLRG